MLYPLWMSRYLWHVVIKSTSWRSMYMIGRFIITMYRCVCVCVCDGARGWSCIRRRASARWALREVSEVISGVFGRVSAVGCSTFCMNSQISLTSKTCDWSDFRIKLATLYICLTRKSWSGRRETHWLWASVTSSITTSSSPPPFKRNITGEQLQQLVSLRVIYLHRPILKSMIGSLLQWCF